MNHWIRPSCDSRTGASHLRRGAPCQDASGFVGFRDAAGTPIQVLVLSDGHGGSRYVRSDVGARLACAVAMQELQQALTPARVAAPGALQEWRGWLTQELPERIVAAWLRQVEHHWRTHPAGEESSFSPLLYGATLGVLLLTPGWWAHTGLGDWDLVRIEADGGEALLSEEPQREGGGEATFSLCLERAGRHFAPRTALQPLTPDTPPFALLLGSDGLRKSCGSDADFLTLCRYLVGLAPTGDQAGCAERAEALDHISRQGSGDDISIAVARWAPAEQAPAWPGPGHSLPAQLVQPAPAAPAGLPNPAMATPHEPGAGARLDQPLPGSPAAAPAEVGSRRSGPGSAQAQPARGRRSPGGRLAPAAALLALGGVGLLIAAALGLAPFARRPGPSLLALTPQQRSDLQRQVATLCGSAANPGGGPDRASAAAEQRGAASRGADAARSGSSATSQAPAREAAGSPAMSGAPSTASPGPATPTARQPASGPAAASSASVPAGPSLASSAGQRTAARLSPGSAVAPAAGARRAASPGGASVPIPGDPQRQQRIAATLAARASVFQRLGSGDPAQVEALLRQSHADPLSALIAYSGTDASLRPAPAERPGWLRSLGRQAAGLLSFARTAGGGAPAPTSPLTALGACPELTQALHTAWQRHGSRDAAAPPLTPGSSAAAVPVRATGAAPAPAQVISPASPPRPAEPSRPQAPEPGASSR